MRRSWWPGFLVCCCLLSCNVGRTMASELSLVKEVPLAKLLGKGRYEASGVTRLNGLFYVVLDNDDRVVEISSSLKTAEWLGISQSDVGFEGITVNQNALLLVEEAVEIGSAYQAKIHRHTFGQAYREEVWLSPTFSSDNKGIEGLASLTINGQDYLLALCEGNQCRRGKKGKKPGKGRLHLFQRMGNEWQWQRMIKLPKSVKFEDYSGLAVRANGDLMVVSQSSSALWIGALNTTSWKIKGDGRQYQFPLNKKGKTTYCNIEGVDWVNDDTVVVVSDAAKKKQKKRCRQKAQSIHLFRL